MLTCNLNDVETNAYTFHWNDNDDNVDVDDDDKEALCG